MKKSTYLEFKAVQDRLTAIETILAPIVPGYVAARDAVDAQLRADIATLTTGNSELQAGIDAAFDKAEQARAQLSQPTT